MKYNYNYVYRITNKILNKHYYGVRSSKIEPKLDLGVKYISSSKDKEFIKDQKENKLNYKYKIVRICATREKATTLEIKLHEKFNVGINESFYNKAKQTSTGFDFSGVTGRKPSDETRQKMSKAGKGENNSMFGKKHSDETKLKISEANKGENNYFFGRKHSEESKQKMSKALKGVPQEEVQCPHCGKIGGKSLMKRWHFDNCKYKEDKE
jgi:group I intron endonuclease